MIPGGENVEVLYEILTLLSLCVFFIATCCALYAFIRMVRSDLIDRRDSSSSSNHR